jgi:MFS family permease
MSHDENSAFRSASDKIQFWCFCLSTFLTYLTVMSTSFLSVVLSSASVSPGAIGLILASPVFTIIVAIFSAGFLIQAFSALSMATVGQLICLVSFISFQWAIPDLAGTLASRAALGFGTGLFFPAAMVYAKNRLKGANTTYFFGIFSSMTLVPAALAPTIAEIYFNRFGTQTLFLALSAPLFFGIVISLLLRRNAAKEGIITKRGDITYLGLLKSRQVLIPNFIVSIVGLLWGFVLSFMALLLVKNNVKTPYFFSVCTIVLLTSRLFVLKFFSVARREHTVFVGLWLMATSYCALSLFQITNLTAVGAAVPFGIGYSLAFPIISVWVSDQFEPHDRGKPVALLSACFHLGIFLAPLPVGIINAYMSLQSIMLGLAIVAVAASMLLLKTPLTESSRSELPMKIRSGGS